MKPKQRDALRDTANFIGLALGIYIGVSLLLQFLAQALLGAFWPRDSLASVGEAPSFLVALLNLCLAVGGLFVAIQFLRKRAPKQLVPKINMTDPKDVRLWLFLPVFLGVGILCSIITALMQSVLEKNAGYVAAAGAQLPEGFFALVLSFFTLCVAPAVLEEYFCRGLLQGMLARWGVWFSILVSSALFTLLHGDITRMPAIFILSVCLGLMAHITNSLMPSMMLHFANNVMSFLLLCAAQKMQGVSALAMTIYLIIFFCFAAAICLYLVFKYKLFSTLRPIPRFIDRKNRQGRFLRLATAPIFALMLVWLCVRALWPLFASKP